MVRNGDITPVQAQAASDEELSFAATPFPIRAPHFVMYVWELLRRDYGEDVLFRQGLRVHTTVDVDLQERARDITRFHLARLSGAGSRQSHNASNAALVAMDPTTGEVLAMVGSPDYFDDTIDGAVNVALMPRQPGSAIKPLTYAAAFSRDYTPATMLLDVCTAFTTKEGNPYTPLNYDGAFHGPVLLRQALGSSLNIVAVKVLQHAGIEELLSLAHQMGITTLQDTLRYGLSLTLGGGEVRLLELAAAYAAFANGGLRVDPCPILRVESADGQVLWTRHAVDKQRVVEERVAYLITDILGDDSARIAAFGEGSDLALSRPSAAKTGTTTDWRDNWTIGYTPQLVAGVWVGNADNSPMVNVSGIHGAAPIWHQFMEEALKGKPPLAFRQPSGLVSVEICADSGMLPGHYCPHRRREWFIAGSEPKEGCTMHRLVLLDRRDRELATEHTPPEHVVEELGVFLPPEASEWVNTQQGRSDALLVIVGPGASQGEGQCISLSSPAPNSTYRLASDLPASSQRIEIRAQLNAPSSTIKVMIFVNGSLLSAFDKPPYRVLWQLSPGKHHFEAEATDGAGNTWSSPAVEVTVLK
jgi:membrane carboxypeptidase/penicillin-binding protein